MSNLAHAIRGHSFQIEAVESIWKYFASNDGNPVIAMPTGSGKSVVIALFLHSVFQKYRNQKILVLTHVKELIQQNFTRLQNVWPFAPAGIYSAGLRRRDTQNSIILAGIASIYKRPDEFGRVDLLIVDECHLVNPQDGTMYSQFLTAMRTYNPYIKVIGLSATPWRMGQGKITDQFRNANGELENSIFTDFCFDITGVDPFNRLIAEGFLSPLIPKKTETVLLTDGVHMRGGDFNLTELQRAVNKDEITYEAIEESLELIANRKRGIVFTTGIEHTINTTKILNYFGIPSVGVHSKDMKGRDAGIKGFKAGVYKAIVNADMLTTGFDVPDIDFIIVLRPTMSPVVWVQLLGRGTRCFYAPGFDILDPYQRMQAIELGGKGNCLVLDFAHNSKNLGPINDPVVPRRKGQGGGDAPIKDCPMCGTWVHAGLKYCNGVKADFTKCNYGFTFETKIRTESSTNEIIKGELPVVETFDVQHITYSEHKKTGSPPSLKVSYYCGIRMFKEFICFEHEIPNVKARARERWRQRSHLSPPNTIGEALFVMDTAQIKAPRQIRVWTNKKYPEILAHVWPEDGHIAPTTEVHHPNEVKTQTKNSNENNNLGEDIPF